MLNKFLFPTLICLLFAQCNTNNNHSNSSDVKDGALGKQLYNQNCASCHALTKGTNEPTLATMSMWSEEILNQKIAKISSDSTHKMYFSSLSSTDVSSIKNYIKNEVKPPQYPTQ